MRLPIIITAAALTLMSACAQSPGSIEPVSMGAAYSGVSCEQASIEYASASNALAALSSKQKGAVAGDAVGVLLIGVPVSSLTGGDVSGQIALEKGKIASLDARLLGCGAL
jgi:hypothetical protein